MSTDASSPEYGPWNPGIISRLPREYLPLSTMFRTENVSTSLEEAREFSDFCGLEPHELVAFRAERLVVHELLIHVTGDLTVPDGPNYADLGISFREIAAKILAKYIAPHMAELNKRHQDLNRDAAAWIESELSRLATPRAGPESPRSDRRGLSRLFGIGESRTDRVAPKASPEERLGSVLDIWRERSIDTDSPFEKACLEALVKIVAAITRERGRLMGDTSLITRLATTMVCNGHGSEIIGEAIDPYFREAVAREGYRLLPHQTKPVVMNVKGASASGKSTLRPLQRTLADKLAIPWHDFALISPDIWRKFLLDYDSLGAAYKYAGTMTAHELEIVDKKLDRYMANKAAAGAMSHLLIDRFRFDSFVPESDGDGASKLLTRFGDLVFMFFMITPPEATVERAWKRGLVFGRYKAVDDLLDHNVEAYTGMPQLFFTWALRTKKRVHYEFLDNSVPEGSLPRTVAFGWNGEMNILDIKSMLDIDRFRKINIDAKGPEDLYDGATLAPEKNVEFLQQCARLIPVINFVDQQTGYLFARLIDGKWIWRDDPHLARVLTDQDAKAGFDAIGSNDDDPDPAAKLDAPRLDQNQAHTLGVWGTEAG